jgi:hypothetical protein
MLPPTKWARGLALRFTSPGFMLTRARNQSQNKKKWLHLASRADNSQKAEARGGARQVRRCGSEEGGMTEVETREVARMGRQSGQG